MDKKYYDNLIVSASPHLVTAMDTQKTMLMVLIALLPSLCVSTYVFGFRVVILTAVCIAASMFFEWGWNKLMKRPQTVTDLSAALTGTLIAFNVPSSLPYWIAIIGCFVAIVIVKQLFGGIGKNIANPAITARIVLFLSFTTDMTVWADPSKSKVFSAADAVTSATPLGIMNEGGIAEAEAQFSNLTMFLGNTGGSMGEVCAAALLLGGLFLIIMKVISPATPIAFLGTMAVISLIAGADPVWQICAGGAMLGAFFMATDYVTTPTTTMGKVIFGIGCGLVTMLIRLYGNYPEGVSFSILLMNILTPHIDSFCEKRLYGNPKKAAKLAEKKAAGGAK